MFAKASRSVTFTITPGGPVKKQDMTAVQPASGPLAGGNTIVLVGHGLADATKVTIAGEAAKFEVVSDTKISVVVPPAQKPGAVNIRVTVGPPSGAVVAPDGYTYADAPVAPDATVTTPTVTSVPEAGQAGFGNPETSRILAPGVVLVSRAEASRLTAKVLKRPLGSSPANAPTVRVRVGRPFALAVGDQAVGQVVNVRVGVRGKAMDVGADRVDPIGWLRVPALAMTRLGSVTLALVTPTTGKRGFVRIVVSK